MAEIPQDASWKIMDTAPRDGSPFLVQYLPYGSSKLCMRRVRFVADGDQVAMQDAGAWLIVGGIDDGFTERLPTSGEPSWSVAADVHNDTSKWRWSSLPSGVAQ